MATSLPLQIQTLASYDDQTLVLAHIAILQKASGAAVSPTDVRDTFVRLRLPTPANVSQHLASLRRQQLLMQPSPATWALTPLGVERIRQLMMNVSDKSLAGLYASEPAQPSFGEAPHHLIPAELAPAQFQVGIGRFLKGHPFDLNVFGITRFPSDGSDPLAAALDVCRKICASEGFEFHLASDRTVDDYLLGNVSAFMWASRYGIALLEDRAKKGLNYNAVLEVGAMLVTGRRCLLLKDVSCPDLPTDLVGQIYSKVDLDNPDSVSTAVAVWLKGLLES